MMIRKAQLWNYKNYQDTGALEFVPGFNVIIGRNDAGKTALVEGLSLRFQSHPTRSLATVPFRGATHDQMSRCSIVFEIEAAELDELIATFPDPTHLDIPKGATAISTFDAFQSTLQKKVTVSAEFNDQGAISGAHILGILSGNASNMYLNLSKDSSRKFVRGGERTAVPMSQTWPFQLAALLKERIYAFRAERLNLAQSPISHVGILKPAAENLAQVLHVLSARNPPKFDRFEQHVREIFPHIRQVTAPPHEGQTVRILLWPTDRALERDDLAISLADSGTGIGQVLAILYVVVTADYPQVIIIDEPQSFLHPGAAQKLIEIVKRYKQHQFIITTHSPATIVSAEAAKIFFARRGESGTTLEIVDRQSTDQLRGILLDVGARLSDVFGADKILWVEGKTEEVCFPLLVEAFAPQKRGGLQILGVRHTSDFEKKDVERTVEIYRQLCTGHSLLPPALGFIFDSERLNEREKTEIASLSQGAVHFLPRRMFESYLVVPSAIAIVLFDLLGGVDCPSVSQIEAWITAHKWRDDFFDKPVAEGCRDNNLWNTKVHGAKVLMALFSEITDARLKYRKVEYGPLLTKSVLLNAPEEFADIRGLLIRL